MTQIIDRRLNGKNKSAVNRQRFIRRFKDQIRKSVSDAVAQRSITDMEKGEKINIPSKDTLEPIFGHGQGGRREAVNPGNKEFVSGDKVKRPPQSGGSGSGDGEASNSGEGEDDFVFQLSRDEFLEFFFEDLELPDLIKTQLTTVVEYKMVRAGYTTSGVPTNINIVRSMRGAMARRIALRGPHMTRLRELQEELEEEEETTNDAENTTAKTEIKTTRINKLKKEIIVEKEKVSTIPFIDTFDLRYNHRIKEPKPSTQAVMFCIMDVSGSMNEERKDIAKRFFILLYLFLTR
ncbi:MAG: YeaH/YhbH family protein, partial [Thiohalomonadales bacterium]